MPLRDILLSPGINIKDVTLPSPERVRQLPFDPRHDIRSADLCELDHQRHNARATYDQQCNELTLAGIVRLSAVLQLLKDQRATGYYADDVLWPALLRQVQQYRQIGEWHDFARHASAAKLLDPGRSADLQLDDETWERLQTRLDFDSRLYGANQEVVAKLARNMKILYPRRQLRPHLNTIVRDGLLALLTSYRAIGAWKRYRCSALTVRLIWGQDKLAGLLGEAEWKAMRDQLGVYRASSNWGEFADHALELTLLAAEEILITDQLVQVTLQAVPFQEPLPPLPIIRRF